MIKKDSSLTSNSNRLATLGQFKRVRNLAWEVIEEALESGQFTRAQFQQIHANGGSFRCRLRQLFAGFVRDFAPRSTMDEAWIVIRRDRSFTAAVEAGGYDDVTIDPTFRPEDDLPPAPPAGKFRVKFMTRGDRLTAQEWLAALDGNSGGVRFVHPLVLLAIGEANLDNTAYQDSTTFTLWRSPTGQIWCAALTGEDGDMPEDYRWLKYLSIDPVDPDSDTFQSEHDYAVTVS